MSALVSNGRKTALSDSRVNEVFKDLLRMTFSFSLFFQFHLVCDKDYLPSTINSIQVAGVLVGHIVAGQLADLYGRKPTLFASVLIILVSQLVGYFSVAWQMFAICMFFVGFGGSFFSDHSVLYIV